MVHLLLAPALALCLGLPEQEARYRDGIDRYNRGRFAASLEDFRAAVREAPDGPFTVPSLWKIAELLLDSRDEEGHVRALAAIAARDRAGNGRRAALELARFLAARSLSGDAARVYALLLRLPGDEGRAEALAFLRRAGDGSARAPEGFAPLAEEDLARIGRLLAARDRADRRYASADAVLHGEILDLLERGAPEAHAAMRRFLELYDRSPFAPAVRFELARAEERLGQLGTALNLYRTARAGPADPALARECDRRLGFLLRRLGRDAEALPHLEAAGERLAAALVALDLRKPERALDALDATLAAAGHPPPRTARELERALPEVRRAAPFADLASVRTVDRSTRSFLARADEALAERRLDSAEVLLARALERSPAHDGALLGLAFARLLAGRNRPAREALEPLLARHEADALLLELSSYEARSSGRHETAARALLRLAGLRASDLRAALARLEAEGFRPSAPEARGKGRP